MLAQILRGDTFVDKFVSRPLICALSTKRPEHRSILTAASGRDSQTKCIGGFTIYLPLQCILLVSSRFWAGQTESALTSDQSALRLSGLHKRRRELDRRIVARPEEVTTQSA